MGTVNCREDSREKKLKKNLEYIQSSQAKWNKKVLSKQKNKTKQDKYLENIEVQIKLVNNLLDNFEQEGKGVSYNEQIKEKMKESLKDLSNSIKFATFQNWLEYTISADFKLKSIKKKQKPKQRISQADVKRYSKIGNNNNSSDKNLTYLQSQILHQLHENDLKQQTMKQSLRTSSKHSQISEQNTQLPTSTEYVSQRSQSPDKKSFSRNQSDRQRMRDQSFGSKFDVPELQRNFSMPNKQRVTFSNTTIVPSGESQNFLKLTQINSTPSHAEQPSSAEKRDTISDSQKKLNMNLLEKINNSKFSYLMREESLKDVDQKNLKGEYEQKQVHDYFRFMQFNTKNDQMMVIVLEAFCSIFSQKYQIFIQQQYKDINPEQIDHIKDSIKNDIDYIAGFLGKLFDIIFGSFIKETLKHVQERYIQQEKQYILMRFIYSKSIIHQQIMKIIFFENYGQYRSFQTNMKQLQNIRINCKEICNIPEIFQLKNEIEPYQPVIDKLKQIHKLQSPIMKFEVIASIREDIFACIDEYYKDSDNMGITQGKKIKNREISVEQINEILIYCLLKSEEYKLFLDVEFIDNFMPDDIDTYFEVGSQVFRSFQITVSFISMLQQQDIQNALLEIEKLQEEEKNFIKQQQEYKFKMVSSIIMEDDETEIYIDN